MPPSYTWSHTKEAKDTKQEKKIAQNKLLFASRLIKEMQDGRLQFYFGTKAHHT